MRALLLFILLLFIALTLPAQIRLHQIENLPVQFHAPGTLYAIGDVVKTSDGMLYRATASTTTTPPGADWEGFDSGGAAADGNGILDGVTDTVANSGWWAFPLNANADSYGRFSMGRQQNSNSFVSGPLYTAAGGEQAAFFFTVDSLGSYLNGEFTFFDGFNTTRYRPGSMFFQGNSAPFGQTLSFTSTGMQFNATFVGSPYIAMPTAGPGVSANGRVRVTDGTGATTWEDYTPAADITDDQTLSLSGTNLTIEDGNTVDLSVVQDGTIDGDSNPANELQVLSIDGQDLSISNGNTVTLPGGGSTTNTNNGFEINGSSINPNGVWKKVASKDISGADFGANRNTGLSGASATYRGKYNRTYFAYYEDTNIECFVSYYDHDLKTFGPAVSWGIPRTGASDNHAYPELTVTPQGHILLVQEELDGTGSSNHNTPHWFRRSTNPEDISSYVEDGPLILYGSYPNLAVIGDTIHYTQRFSQDLSTEHHVVGYMMSDDDGDNWKLWDGTAVSSASDSMDVLVDIGPSNYWAYNWLTEANGYMYKTITLANFSPNFNYPVSYLIFSRDGRTWGNYEWFIGAASGAWSKDVPGTSHITLAELNTNAIIAGDATIDSDSSNLVYDAIIYGDELHYVWGKGLRVSGDNIWSDFVYTIVTPDGARNDYSLTAGNALAPDTDQMIYGQILASDDQLMVKLLDVDNGTIRIVSSSNGGKNWVLADSYGSVDQAASGSVSGHGDRTNTDYSKGAVAHISSAPNGLRVDIYELVDRGSNEVAGTEYDAGGTYTINWKHSRDVSLELTANSTLNFTNVGEGEPGTIRVVQDGGGSNSLAMNFYSDDLSTLLSSKRVGPYSSIDFTGGNTTAVKYERIGDVVVYEYVQESTISGGGGGTDDQTLSLSGNTLSIEDGNSVDLSSVGGGGSSSFRGVRAEARSAQTFGTSFTKLNLTYEDFDTDGWFDLANDRFQPDVAGYYSITGGIVFSALAEGNVAIVELRKNGTRWCILSRGTGSATSGTNLGGYSGADIVYLNGTTDYIELWGWNGQASDRSIFVSDGYNRFSAHLIGE